jgi:hypothetical protein
MPDTDLAAIKNLLWQRQFAQRLHG